MTRAGRHGYRAQGEPLLEPRLDRRLILLRGKQRSAFDLGQYWYERTPRAAAARKLCALLRVGRPLVLHTPRWSQPQRLLEDVSVDLQLGAPRVACEVVNVQAVQGKSALQCWGWVMQRLTGFCGLPVDRRLSQAVSRDGFRTLLGDLLVRSAVGPPRCAMLMGLEAIHLDALRDIVAVYGTYAASVGEGVGLNLLVAGAVDGPQLGMEGTTRVSLPDYAPSEAIEALVEQVGPHDVARLQRAARLTGGIPALLDRIASHGPAGLDELSAPDAVWRLLGPLAAEIRNALQIAWAEPSLSKRMEALARGGAHEEVPDVDHRLVDAGLVRRLSRGSAPRVEIRAPLFGELAQLA